MAFPDGAVEAELVLGDAAGIVAVGGALAVVDVAELAGDPFGCAVALGVLGQCLDRAEVAERQVQDRGSCFCAVPVVLPGAGDPRAGADRAAQGELLRPQVLDADRLGAREDSQRQVPAPARSPVGVLVIAAQSGTEIARPSSSVEGVEADELDVTIRGWGAELGGGGSAAEQEQAGGFRAGLPGADQEVPDALQAD